MKKISPYLELEVDADTARMAKQRGITKVTLMRRDLLDAVGLAPHPRFSAIGIGNGPGPASAAVDRQLAETEFGT